LKSQKILSNSRLLALGIFISDKSGYNSHPIGKSQDPNPKIQTISNPQFSKTNFVFWNLRFIWDLVFGSWDLILREYVGVETSYSRFNNLRFYSNLHKHKNLPIIPLDANKRRWMPIFPK
jgi:hypothetical protein